MLYYKLSCFKCANLSQKPNNPYTFQNMTVDVGFTKYDITGWNITASIWLSLKSWLGSCLNAIVYQACKMWVSIDPVRHSIEDIWPKIKPVGHQ